jgi:pyruvate dehydrogenase E1 component alpha subunit
VIGQLEDADRIYTAHRAHGHFIAAGVDPFLVMAELAGRETGLCAGRGGSMHLMSERAVLATGVVGGQVPVAVGHAATLEPGLIAVVFFGDGAVQTGSWLESINLAALWQVPLLLVCENNGWAEFTSRDEHTNVKEVRDFGQLHGLPTAVVDGSDYSAVRDHAARLIGEVRRGGGPALLECHVTRIRPHFEGDLRKATEAGRDPVAIFANKLRAGGVASETIDAIDAAADAEADRLLRRALAEAPSDPARDPDLVYARSVR